MTQRTIDALNPYSCIQVMDEPSGGGACHDYMITVSPPDSKTCMCASKIKFQNGPVAEKGVNGCTNEDLLAVVVDRLEYLQAGPFPCRENALALTKIQEALHWLKHRTEKRKKRGVEGTNVK